VSWGAVEELLGRSSGGLGRSSGCSWDGLGEVCRGLEPGGGDLGTSWSALGAIWGVCARTHKHDRQPTVSGPIPP